MVPSSSPPPLLTTGSCRQAGSSPPSCSCHLWLRFGRCLNIAVSRRTGKWTTRRSPMVRSTDSLATDRSRGHSAPRGSIVTYSITGTRESHIPDFGSLSTISSTLSWDLQFESAGLLMFPPLGSSPSGDSPRGDGPDLVAGAY